MPLGKQLFAGSRLSSPRCRLPGAPAARRLLSPCSPGTRSAARGDESRLRAGCPCEGNAARPAPRGAAGDWDRAGRGEAGRRARPGAAAAGGATSDGTDGSGSGGRGARKGRARPASPPPDAGGARDIPDRAHAAGVVSPTRPAVRAELLRVCNLWGHVGGLFPVEP